MGRASTMIETIITVILITTLSKGLSHPTLHKQKNERNDCEKAD
jgi:hypothetical protein